MPGPGRFGVAGPFAWSAPTLLPFAALGRPPRTTAHVPRSDGREPLEPHGVALEHDPLPAAGADACRFVTDPAVIPTRCHALLRSRARTRSRRSRSRFERRTDSPFICARTRSRSSVAVSALVIRGRFMPPSPRVAPPGVLRGSEPPCGGTVSSGSRASETRAPHLRRSGPSCTGDSRHRSAASPYDPGRCGRDSRPSRDAPETLAGRSAPPVGTSATS